MEETREEKQERNHCNENVSRSDEQKDIRNSDESAEKLRIFAGTKEDEEDNNELEGNPNESSPVSAAADGVTNKRFDCKVCGKEFRSIKAVHGHMRVHSGKKRATEVGSNGGEEESSYSPRPKKQASIKFKPPRTPDSGTPQNPVSNGGEASSSSAAERERSSSERKVEVSDPGVVEAPGDHPEHDPRVLDIALIMMTLDVPMNPNKKGFLGRFLRF